MRIAAPACQLIINPWLLITDELLNINFLNLRLNISFLNRLLYYTKFFFCKNLKKKKTMTYSFILLLYIHLRVYDDVIPNDDF